MKWFTSDQHYYHKNVITYCDRPWQTVDEMNADLVRKYNARVKPDDTCYFLGDFCFGKVAVKRAILQQLNGKKVLVWGNHDGDFGDNEKAGFDLVCTQMKLRLGKKSVLLSHFPYKTAITPDGRHIEKHPDDQGNFLLHGHVHRHWKQKGRMINVGVDVWNFSPVSEETLHGLWDKKQDL